MVAAVDHKVLPVQIADHGHDTALNRVIFGFSFRGLVDLQHTVVHVLVDVAAQGDVHHLMATADTQDGLILIDASVDQGNLCLVAGEVDVIGTQVALHKDSGIHIAAACQDESVKLHLDVRAMEGQRFTAGLFHGSFIQTAALGGAGNQNTRFHRHSSYILRV